MLNPPLPHPTPPFSGMNAVHEVSEGMPFCRLTLYIDLHSGVSVRFRITLGQNRTAGDSDVVFLQKTPPPQRPRTLSCLPLNCGSLPFGLAKRPATSQGCGKP